MSAIVQDPQHIQEEKRKPEKKSIINCHTHIFTGDHVPPWLAKTFLPWPFYYLVPLSFVVGIFRFYYRGPYTWKFQGWYKRSARYLYKVKTFIARNWIARLVGLAIGIWLTLHAIFIFFDWLADIIAADSEAAALLNQARAWLSDRNLLYIPMSGFLKVLIVIAVILFVKAGRNLIIFLMKRLWKFLRFLPGKHTGELIARYLNIGRFSFHQKQEENYKRLRNQYPGGSGFVILPMDMEFMKAGSLSTSYRYREQMNELARIKDRHDKSEDATLRDRFFPFVFIDPRRLRQDPDFFKYHLEGGKVILEDCFVKEFIVTKGFKGFKIYPALGYYPFEEELLPVWKYAADNEIPILTHCIRGNIFYRGDKKGEWDYHPVFEQALGNGVYKPLLLHQVRNIEFINNFTHPMNYLCLLEEELLRKIVTKSTNPNIWELFNFQGEKTPLGNDLHHLKICFGHFGGEDEWKRFMELDRDNYSSQLVKQPDWGVDFLVNEEGERRPGKPEQIWHSVDWYTIICSLMLQHPNVYSDLSFILYDPSIQPLLKFTMQNRKLKYRVLFGTDFYVVRNHKSEKSMLAELVENLTEVEFDLIARDNPREFLHNSIHGPITI